MENLYLPVVSYPYSLCPFGKFLGRIICWDRLPVLVKLALTCLFKRVSDSAFPEALYFISQFREPVFNILFQIVSAFSWWTLVAFNKWVYSRCSFLVFTCLHFFLCCLGPLLDKSYHFRQEIMPQSSAMPPYPLFAGSF